MEVKDENNVSLVLALIEKVAVVIRSSTLPANRQLFIRAHLLIIFARRSPTVDAHLFATTTIAAADAVVEQNRRRSNGEIRAANRRGANTR